MNIPIYRAKTIDGEWVEGYYVKHCFGADVIMSGENDNEGYWEYFIIDQETLAIHFPDMIDKNGERIFAALNDSGVGASLLADGNALYYYVYVDAHYGFCPEFLLSEKTEYGSTLFTPLSNSAMGIEITCIYEGETK